MHPAEQLWARHHPPTGYPEDVVPVPRPIPGLAFFPGGYGLWRSRSEHALPEFPAGGVMVLGHDFHSVTGYEESLRLSGERLTLPTWRNLLALLRTAGVALERCFFTNLYMGLRASASTTGLFPGATDEPFVRHCQSFILEQLRVQRPALMVTLGVHVPPVIGRLSPELAPWAAGRGLKHLDSVGPLRTGVTFPGVENLRTTVAALLHPSLRHASLRHHRYASVEGAEAEHLILRDGLVAAGMSAG